MNDKDMTKKLLTPFVLLIGLIAITCISYTWEWTRYRCPYCGAVESRTKIASFNLPVKTQEGPLAAYWKKHVDPHHVHHWVSLCKSNIGIHRDYSANFQTRWYVPDEAMIAVLKCLSSSEERKKYAQSLWMLESQGSEDQHQWAHKVFRTIGHSYRENPGRTDWPKILKALGRWPKSQ
ncbi:MAG: hypothetical protein ABFD83_02690 [Armatimonadota bacterium]